MYKLFHKKQFIFLNLLFCVLFFLIIIIFRILYFYVIRESIIEYKSLDYITYLAYSFKNDIKLWLSIMIVVGLISFALSGVKKSLYAIYAVLLGLLSSGLLAGVIYFKIFEIPVDLSSIQNGLGGFEKAILFSATYEISPQTYWYLLLAFLLPVFFIFLLYKLYESNLKIVFFKKVLFLKIKTKIFTLRNNAWIFIAFIIFLVFINFGVIDQRAIANILKNNIQYRSLHVSPREIIKNPILEVLNAYVYPNNILKRENDSNFFISQADFTYKLNTDSLTQRNIINQFPIKRGVKYNIIFYFLESVSQKYTKLKVDKKLLMPNFQRLVKNSFVSKNHYTQNPLSIHSIISVLSSSYEPPSQSWVSSENPGIKIKSASEILHEHGYQTGLFHSGSLKHFNFHRYIRNRKFNVTIDFDTLKDSEYETFMDWSADDRAMIDASLEFLDKRKNKPFFLVYLPAAPHHPYVVPDESFQVVKPETSDKELNSWQRYQNSIHYADHVVGRLVDNLEKKGLMKNTLFFLFADHGEAFFQHPGNYLHALYIYEENVHVPFLIYNKNLFPEKHDYPGISRHIDILPTVLDILGIPLETEHEGISLFSKHKQQFALFKTHWSKEIIGIRDGPWKYIFRISDQKEELYNLDKDPSETKNIIESQKQLPKVFQKSANYARQYGKQYYQALSNRN